uniref:Immunoglobulin V-set domain-containing protein n=1 Tax=Neolamprologus brichardi TaxID=32507 RepID=A0A3Q4HWH4_NEOBR
CIQIIILPLLLCLHHVFVLHGNDLHLDIEKPVKLDELTDLFWKFNYSNNIAKCVFNNDPVVFNKYAGRAELFRPNCSLKLKNVQHSDSGDYTAFMVSYTCFKYFHTCCSPDSVTPAQLTVESVSKTSDSCNLTVTCSTVDFNISSSFRCDGKICSHAGKKDLNTTKNLSSLSVYLQQDTIFCNHSNQVSWNQTMKVFLKDLLCNVCMLCPCLITYLWIVIESIHNPIVLLSSTNFTTQHKQETPQERGFYVHKQVGLGRQTSTAPMQWAEHIYHIRGPVHVQPNRQRAAKDVRKCNHQ